MINMKLQKRLWQKETGFLQFSAASYLRFIVYIYVLYLPQNGPASTYILFGFKDAAALMQPRL